MTEPNEPKPDKAPRSIQVLATLALLFIAGGTAGVIGSIALSGDEAATNSIITLSTLSVGAIVALAGAKNGDK